MLRLDDLFSNQVQRLFTSVYCVIMKNFLDDVSFIVLFIFLK
jgi:hypothetical protein